MILPHLFFALVDGASMSSMLRVSAEQTRRENGLDLQELLYIGLYFEMGESRRMLRSGFLGRLTTDVFTRKHQNKHS